MNKNKMEEFAKRVNGLNDRIKNLSEELSKNDVFSSILSEEIQKLKELGDKNDKK